MAETKAKAKTKAEEAEVKEVKAPTQKDLLDSAKKIDDRLRGDQAEMAKKIAAALAK